jgi:hypothetical protein
MIDTSGQSPIMYSHIYTHNIHCKKEKKAYIPCPATMHPSQSPRRRPSTRPGSSLSSVYPSIHSKPFLRAQAPPRPSQISTARSPPFSEPACEEGQIWMSCLASYGADMEPKIPARLMWRAWWSRGAARPHECHPSHHISAPVRRLLQSRLLSPRLPSLAGQGTEGQDGKSGRFGSSYMYSVICTCFEDEYGVCSCDPMCVQNRRWFSPMQCLRRTCLPRSVYRPCRGHPSMSVPKRQDGHVLDHAGTKSR